MVSTSSDAPVDFVISYDGPALAEHTIPVRDLAPALLALGQAFERANSILNGDQASISLEIRATSEGSFEIVLILKQLIDSAAGPLSGAFISSAANVTELVIGGRVATIGLLGLIKRLRGSRPKEVERTNDDKVVLEVDKLRLEVPARVLDLYKDSNMRDYIEAVVRPLSRQGIDKLSFRQDQQPLESVEKVDVAYFESADLEDEGVTKTIIPRQRLKLAAVSFEKKGKWRLNDGERIRWYAIKDEGFASEVEQGLRRFGTGDLLICEVVMIQYVEPELKLEYAVTRVLEHLPRPEQGRLPEN